MTFSWTFSGGGLQAITGIINGNGRALIALSVLALSLLGGVAVFVEDLHMGANASALQALLLSFYTAVGAVSAAYYLAGGGRR